MNRGEEEGRWADWFDFLWNRTRAIRKDITQQHLGDTTAVELMEKCARYVRLVHIIILYQFDFLWNQIGAIHNDITQQHLGVPLL